MELASRIASLSPSATLAITAKAKEMKAQGIDVISLGAGEPDFNTPEEIIEATYESMKKGLTKYTPSSGLMELKQVICEKLATDQNLNYNPSEIIVTNGAKQALYLIFQALLNPGDEVIIPVPYWVSYPEQVKLAGGTPVFVEGKEENAFKITPEQLSARITERTKALVLNSPSNPTGMIYTRDELEKIGEICLQHNIVIISDEIYEKLVYGDNKHVSIAEISPELKQQTILVNGVSKSHAMTGFRIGYAAGDEAIIQAMTTIASHSTSNPATPSQYATIAAYKMDQRIVEQMVDEFSRRLDIFYDKIKQIPGFSCVKPQGSFYLFPNVRIAALKCGYDSVDAFAKAILEEAHVAVVPGSGFGAPDYIRLSYATSLHLLEDAAERIHSFVEKKWK